VRKIPYVSTCISKLVVLALDALAGAFGATAVALRETLSRDSLIGYDTEDHLCSLCEVNIFPGGFQDGKLRTRFRRHHG
jgi:hypothetical protein